MTQQDGHTWLKSLGGPLIAVPGSVVRAWFGTDGPGDPDDIDEEETDYWRACSAPDPVGVIDVEGKSALVLRTSSVPTAYVQSSRVFVHEMAKTGRTDTLNGALELISGLQWQAAGSFSVEEELVLFDASFPGGYALSHEHVIVDVPPGSYKVEWAHHKPSTPSSVWVILVRLL